MKKEDTLRVLMAYGKKDDQMIVLVEDAILEISRSIDVKLAIHKSFAGSRIISKIEIARPRIVILLNNHEYVQGCFTAYQPAFHDVNFCVIDGRGSPAEDFLGAALFFPDFPEEIEKLQNLMEFEGSRL